MALTQVESGGIKDGTIVAADIANDTIGWEKINENAITANELASNAVGTAAIVDDSITEVKLDISNAPSDGKFLQYKNNSDKLTWAAASS